MKLCLRNVCSGMQDRHRTTDIELTCHPHIARITECDEFTCWCAAHQGYLQMVAGIEQTREIIAHLYGRRRYQAILSWNH